MYVFIVGLKLEEDGSYAEFTVHAKSSMMAVVKALEVYFSKANYPILEIWTRKLS